MLLAGRRCRRRTFAEVKMLQVGGQVHVLFVPLLHLILVLHLMVRLERL
jgi:hypothetical protein